ncbi:MAG: type II secretion system F family protein [Phycisphaeraceae bacterium]|nr:type II secretion system F family protein [Phycisphaeraceae bacterium]MBX3366859.1 type II secretion system F family protein [Phycisphaeraceae bacterium]
MLAELESRRLTPVTISPAKERTARGRRVSARKLGESYVQIGDLLHAGVPLLRSLKLIAARRSQPKVADVYRHLAETVSDGGELAEAMSRRPEVFPRIHVAMIRAGEKGGFLEGVFSRLGAFVLAQAELRGRIVGSLIYPALLVLFGVLILGVVFGVFVPMFKPVFERMSQLPLSTRLVLGTSDLIAGFGVFIVGGAVATGLLAWRLSKRADVRRRGTEFLTFAPVCGQLVRALAAARFCRLLGTMLENGVPMLQAMAISKEAAGNVLMEEAIDRAIEAVRAGEQLAPPLASSGLFADDIVEMISVGESANNLEKVLLSVAETIEKRIDRLLGIVVRLIEPLMLMAIAGVVVVVAMGLLLPMTQLGGEG